MNQNVWQLQEAKNRFSEVVNKALVNGPQVITRHGVETVVVVSFDEFRKARLNEPRLSEFFANSPLSGADIDLTRDSSSPRADIEL